MSSLIHYRFKAGTGEWSRLAFEGHALPLGELKRRIAEAKKLGPDPNAAGADAARTLQDFELILNNYETGEEYFGDATSIAKNTSVVVKRVPFQRGKTLRLESDPLSSEYSTGARLAPASFDSPASKRLNFGAPAAGLLSPLSLSRGLGAPIAQADEFGEDPLDESNYIQRDEERRAREARDRAAQQAAQQAALETALQQAQQQQPQMLQVQAQPMQVAAGVTAVPYVRPPPSRPPPPHYTCHNCGLRGHWKQSCPTAAHLSAPPTSLMSVTNAHGQSAIMPRAAALAMVQGGTPASAAAVLSAYTNRGAGAALAAPVSAVAPVAPAPVASPSPPDLSCTICRRLFTNPVVVPCCFTSYCDECIRQALVLESRCPRCQSDSISVEQLRGNKVMARRVDAERQRLATLPPVAAPPPTPTAVPHHPFLQAGMHSSLPYQQAARPQQSAVGGGAYATKKIATLGADD